MHTIRGRRTIDTTKPLKNLPKSLRSILHTIMRINHPLHIRARPLIGDSPLLVAIMLAKLPITFLFRFALTQVQLSPRVQRHIDECRGAVLAEGFVGFEGAADGGGFGVGDAAEDFGEDGAVFDGHGRALGEVGKGGVACVAEQGYGADAPR